MGFKVYVGVFCILLTFSACKAKSYEGFQIWKVTPGDDLDLLALSDLQKSRTVEVLNLPGKANAPTLIHVAKEHRDFAHRFLGNRGIDYEVTVGDLEKVIQRQKRRKRDLVDNFEDFNYTVYHKMEEIEQWMDFVVGKYPFVTKMQVGVTFEGRPINALKIQKPGVTKKPFIYMDAMTHAREWITTASLMYLWNEILTTPQLDWMLDYIDWYLVPVVNVDGYVYTWTTDRNWRKTRSTGASGVCDGVDANRNWDDHWSVASRDNPCTYDYHGTMPGSESEVRHLMQFISEHKAVIKGAFTIHSYGQLVMYPYCYKKGVYTVDFEEQRDLAVNMTKAMFESSQTEYTPAQGAEGLDYDWSGNTIDWTYRQAGIKLSYTVELRDQGRYSFFLPPEQIIPTGKELLDGIKVFAQHIKDDN